MPGGSRSPSEIPVITLQCDWDDVIRKVNGTVWVCCKFRGQTSYEGKIHSQGLSNEGIPRVTATEGFSVRAISRSTIQVKHDDSGTTYIFQAPTGVFSGIHSKSVISLDVTSGNLCASVCTENKLHVWDTRVGLVSRTLEGHVGDVYKCRFFPSGIVILSGGADMQLKIWSAETGQCPVTLRGHTAAITDICMVERGRNIISVSKDGTARLWSCGEAMCLATLLKLETTINSCSLGIANNKMQLGEPEQSPSEHEVGTGNKVLLVGCEDGTVNCIAVQSRKKLFSLIHNSAVNCVAVLSAEQFIVGCQDGQILLYESQQPSEPVVRWFESNSAILCILPVKESVPVKSKDDKCRNVRVELTGPDCDPVYDISYDGTCIYTACRDAAVRKYDVT
ncbi:hypothetical protein L9F63_001598, partial [Diploptera punctata]